MQREERMNVVSKKETTRNSSMESNPFVMH